MNAMRLHPLFLALSVSCLTLHAQPVAPDGASPNPKELALDHLLSERGSLEKFGEAVKKAKANGVNEQAILEARFLYHVDRGEDAAIVAMLPDFQKRSDAFKVEESEIFATKEDWLAVIQYVHALDALAKKKMPAFKKHITEAFWLSPRQAAAFAPHIEKIHMDEAMKEVVLDFTLKTKPLTGGDELTFEEMTKGKKATIIHFWSPASAESEDGLANYVTVAKTLSAKAIAMVSVIPASTPEIISEAKTSSEKFRKAAPGHWLIDPSSQPLARTFRIQSLPIFVLIAPDGRVLFNGNPSDNSLWDELKKIDKSISRPQISE